MLTEQQLCGAIYSPRATQFSVWAPKRKQVEVVVEGGGVFPLASANGELFTGAATLSPGSLYRFRLDGGEAFPDPCSRFQPHGVHGPSEVIDPGAFKWTDHDWRGTSAKTPQVIYELHVGTFTPEGTLQSAIARLSHLKSLGVTLIELMPLNGFAGAFGWGYDGVNLYAVNATYGRPDDLRAFVDVAHRQGLGVILDVVYNHFGPAGNYLPQFSDSWFSKDRPAEWGDAVNFDGPGSEGVRRFVSQNAAMWINEYHLDGLRLDATQNLFDQSPHHIVEDICAAARRAAGTKSVWLVGESEKQEARLLKDSAAGRDGLDAIWVDDFHHAARAAMTQQSEGYMRDFEGSARELVSLVRQNSLFQGQFFGWQKKRRGVSLRKVPHRAAVFALQNHDQVSASLEASRISRIASPEVARAMTTFFLLLPQTPMLFMGQEFGATAPFPYFADHDPELQVKVDAGRREFIEQFETSRRRLSEGETLLAGHAAFEKAKLNWSERDDGLTELHRALLALRASRSVFTDPLVTVDAAALDERALVLRWFDGEGDFMLVLALGESHAMKSLSEPLLAAPEDMVWRPLLKSGNRTTWEVDSLLLHGPSATLYEAVREA